MYWYQVKIKMIFFLNFKLSLGVYININLLFKSYKFGLVLAQNQTLTCE